MRLVLLWEACGRQNGSKGSQVGRGPAPWGTLGGKSSTLSLLDDN